MEFWREQRGRAARFAKYRPSKCWRACAVPCAEARCRKTAKAFGCANWKSGCRFTLWKNALKRVKGPMLNQRIVKTLLTEGKVEGTTGLIRLDEGQMNYYPPGADRLRSCLLSIRHQLRH